MKTVFLPRIILLVLIAAIFITKAGATRYSVDVRDFSFSPSTLVNVKIGDTIHWEWKDGTHTTTSTSIPAGAASWDRPISSAAQSYDYIPTMAGTYNYKCTPHASMGMTGSFNVAEPQGVGDQPSPFSIAVYPNPFSNDVTVKYTSQGKSVIHELRVYNVIGRMVASYELPADRTEFETEINTAALPEGLLFFEFRGNTGNRVFVQRMIRE